LEAKGGQPVHIGITPGHTNLHAPELYLEELFQGEIGPQEKSLLTANGVNELLVYSFSQNGLKLLDESEHPSLAHFCQTSVAIHASYLRRG
jgi:hypothetical protein